MTYPRTVVAAALTSALAVAATLAATPAASANPPDDALTQLAESMYVSNQAYDQGVQSQITVGPPSTSTSGAAYSIGIVGANLSMSSRKVDRAWRTGPKGSVTEALIATPNGSLTYYVQLSEVLANSDYFTKRVRSIITADVKARGGSTRSLVPAVAYLGEADSIVTPFTWANPVLALESILEDPGASVDVSESQGGSAVFTITFDDGFGTDVVTVHANEQGRIWKVSGGTGTITVTSFGPDISPARGPLVTVATTTVLGADEYLQKSASLLQHTRLAAEVATERARSQSGKVSYTLLRSVLSEVGILSSPDYIVQSIRSGFRVEYRLSEIARVFGSVCLTVTAGKSPSRVVKC